MESGENAEQARGSAARSGESHAKREDASSSQDLPQQRSVVLALTADLVVVPRLEDVARNLGFEIEVIERADQLGAQGEPPPRSVQLTEPLEGPDAALVRRLVANRPVLILIDTTASSLPWARWIQVLKTSAATRRIPILVFGPHVAEADLQRARQAGADLVLPRGAFLRDLPALIGRWAVQPDRGAIGTACQGELSPTARHGVELINEGKYFEAHEVLEHAWMEAPAAEGTVYRALLQVAVAWLQIERKNSRGATKMMLRVREWLDPLPEQCMGIDLAAVKRSVAELDASLQAGELPSYQITIALPG
jgi:CheY-like chemotaxis protein